MVKLRSEKSLVVGLDLGTSKVSVLVAESNPGDLLEIIGHGYAPNRGIKRGVIVDIEATVDAITKAVRDAEAMASCEIRSVMCSIGGNHVRGQNSQGVVAIRDREVTDYDVERVLEAAKAQPIGSEQKLLHPLPQEYLIDDQDGIRFPIGMSGVRLEARVHLLSASQAATQNVQKCVARAGLQIDQLVVQPLASSISVLTEDEKDLGVLLVDIGAGTTDIAVWSKGALRYTAVLPVAGDQVTSDIAVALRTPTPNAEEIKVKYACALASLTKPDENIQVPSVGDREPRRLARQVLAEVVQPRYDELLNMVLGELRRSGLENLIPAGVVLTGGAARIEGLIDLAEEVFQVPVRLGLPQGITGLSDICQNPSFASGAGLLLFGQQQNRPRAQLEQSRGLAAIWQRVMHWIKGEF
jgi:cell division protein FtsA